MEINSRSVIYRCIVRKTRRTDKVCSGRAELGSGRSRSEEGMANGGLGHGLASAWRGAGRAGASVRWCRVSRVRGEASHRNSAPCSRRAVHRHATVLSTSSALGSPRPSAGTWVGLSYGTNPGPDPGGTGDGTWGTRTNPRESAALWGRRKGEKGGGGAMGQTH